MGSRQQDQEASRSSLLERAVAQSRGQGGHLEQEGGGRTGPASSSTGGPARSCNHRHPAVLSVHEPHVQLPGPEARRSGAREVLGGMLRPRPAHSGPVHFVPTCQITGPGRPLPERHQFPKVPANNGGSGAHHRSPASTIRPATTASRKRPRPHRLPEPERDAFWEAALHAGTCSPHASHLPSGQASSSPSVPSPGLSRAAQDKMPNSLPVPQKEHQEPPGLARASRVAPPPARGRAATLTFSRAGRGWRISKAIGPECHVVPSAASGWLLSIPAVTRATERPAPRGGRGLQMGARGAGDAGASAEEPAPELFRDAAFPASDASLFSDFSTPLAQFREDFTWRRPQELCASPRLFADNPQEGQVKQGLLGDCWFLCACAALQKSRRLLEQVIPPGQPCWPDPAYRGYFTCCVWQFGQWVEVTVDDRLPCLAGRLCFSRCQSDDVFWLPLLEKVYAKVHGSYEHLWAGQVADALVDLTGGLAERWNLKDLVKASDAQDKPSGGGRRTLHQLLHVKDRCLLSCSVLGPRAGAQELGEFHAFIISDLQELQGQAGKGVLLLRIHNPWGRPCWKGPWREGGEGWSQVEAAEALALLSQLQEGEFWVEEEEFLREFDELTLSFPVSEDGHLQSLHSGKVLCHTQSLPGAWVRGQSAGGSRNNSSFPSNPKFWLRVCEPSEVCLAILQRPRGRAVSRTGESRAASSGPASCLGKDLQAVGLHVWKVEKRRVNLPALLSAPPAAGTACHAYDREVHVCCELTPGYYLAVPSTFLKDMAGQFLLRAFSSGRLSLSAIKQAPRSPALGDGVSAGEWETVQLQGCWRAGQTAGGSRNFSSYRSNPCFLFSVPAGSSAQSVRITLRQHCQDGACHPIGFHVFQVPEGSGSPEASSLLDQEPLSSCVPHRHALEVSQLCRLPAGTYGVVPSTYLPDIEASFTVTISTRIDRWSLQSRESLGQPLQEATFTAVMKT
ncbi:PREDICTED: calpain-10 [Elephantulus edwardii]|uniref:calpain-10 n=1 Tax=Elephantulus edwardii TaxID=28737 RepID=UPI0003F0B0FE|nr:PREDICTED: calpain-10 [Elephantulus edwardii]